jgi:signal transduction histidine kinase
MSTSVLWHRRRDHSISSSLTWWERVVAPSQALSDMGDRQRARALAGFLAVLTPLGWVGGIIQLAVLPHFMARFMSMAAALTVLSCAYVLSRTAHYRIGGLLACAAPPAACMFIGLTNPSVRSGGRSPSGAAVAVSTSVVLMLRPGAQPQHVIPLMTFHAIVTPLVILGAAHRNRIERERRQALGDLEAAHRMAMVGHLAGGLAHDFNNLLMVIHGHFAGVVPGESRAQMELAIRRASELTRQLFAYAGRVSGTREDTDLRDVVLSSERLLRLVVGAQISVSIEVGAARIPVRLNRSQLTQVLVNLAMNAREAMPSGTGKLALKIFALAESDRTPLPGRAVITVEDDGVGMSDAVRARLFEPFFTTKGNRGTGLGLSTVRTIVEQHGGEIDVNSTPGGGTKFSIYLPQS